MAKLDEVKSLLSNKMPTGTFEDVFQALIDEFLERHSPARKQQRRDKHTNRKIGSTKPQIGSSTTEKKEPAKKPQTNTLRPNPAKSSPCGALTKRNRHVPASIRDKVFVRDNGQCTYVGKNGKRCGSTRSLQVDHVKPFARGGSTTLPNLRLLCGKHNRLEAKRVLGADVMNRYNRRK
jgi:5-methylcytosine-specific restriction endonuclease McrA